MSAVLHESAMTSASNRQMLVAVAASTFGWALDLFDLFILLFVAPVIGKLFFPSTHTMLSLAAVYASFAVTVLMRPLGSTIFGSYADRRGRKGAMILAVVGVGLSTASFGLLPTVAQVGVIAPVLFIGLRLVQGVFVGGVVASTHTIGTETVAFKYRGAVSGLVSGGGAGFGALIAALVYLGMSSIFPGSRFEVWGWRCMFFTGIISSAVGLLLFTRLEESPVWRKLVVEKTGRESANECPDARVVDSPVRMLFSGKNRVTLLVNLLLTIGGGCGYYLTSGYLPTFLKVVNHCSNGVASLVLVLSGMFVVMSCVLWGHLSTYIGRRRAFLYIGWIRLFALPLLYLALPKVESGFMLSFYAVLLTSLGSAGYAPILIFLNERFPTAIRATGTSVSWNIGFAIGGIMPTFVSLTAANPMDLPVTLAVFSAAASVVYLIGAFVVPETLGKLDRVGSRSEFDTSA